METTLKNQAKHFFFVGPMIFGLWVMEIDNVTSQS